MKNQDRIWFKLSAKLSIFSKQPLLLRSRQRQQGLQVFLLTLTIICISLESIYFTLTTAELSEDHLYHLVDSFVYNVIKRKYHFSVYLKVITQTNDVVILNVLSKKATITTA